MAQTAEAKVKAFIRKYMFENFEDIWYYSPMAGQFGNTGVPDHLYLWKGVFIVIEAKVEGNSPTALQWKHLKHVARQGGVAAVVTGKDLDKMVKIRNAILARIRDGTQTPT